jgi:glucokinase
MKLLNEPVMQYKLQEAYLEDTRVVLTLDAGGTNLVFGAMKGAREIVDPLTIPSAPDDLQKILHSIERGFKEILDRLQEPAHAISFAFPGPANYKRGIIADLPNFSAFRGGVALGPFLEEKFNLPVHINNDGNLYALGEYIFGFLPWVNQIIREQGGEKQYANLVGITLGSGFGCGIVCNGQLNLGDNSNGGELWLMRNRLYPQLCTDASIGREKVSRFYAEFAGIAMEEAPESATVFEIAKGVIDGDRQAALKTFSTLGEIIGDALANTSVLVDGLIVISGGLSGAHEFIMPTVMRELNSTINHLDGVQFQRIAQRAFYLNQESELAQFIKGNPQTLQIPFSSGTVTYDAMPRIGVGISQLGANQAIALGAYVFATSD